MEVQDHRMQCLRMAFELGGNPDAVLSAAERLLQFVAGQPQPAAAIAQRLVDAPDQSATATASQVLPAADPATTDAPGSAIFADPIAACGTAMLMSPSGDLADAVPAPELAAAVEPPAAATVVEDAVADTATEPANAAPAADHGDALPADVLAPDELQSASLAEPAIQDETPNLAADDQAAVNHIDADDVATEVTAVEAPGDETTAAEILVLDAGDDEASTAANSARAANPVDETVIQASDQVSDAAEASHNADTTAAPDAEPVNAASESITETAEKELTQALPNQVLPNQVATTPESDCADGSNENTAHISASHADDSSQPNRAAATH